MRYVPFAIYAGCVVALVALAISSIMKGEHTVATWQFVVATLGLEKASVAFTEARAEGNGA